MRLPVANKVITPHGAFGYVRATSKDGACGVKKVYPCVHKGVDLGGPAGTPVYAPERLRTTFVAFDNATRPLRGFGPGAIRALGASGAVHTLGHLDPEWWRETTWQLPGSIFEGFRGQTQLPAVDRIYEEGEQVGVMSDARHVHWQVDIDRAPVDPLLWVTGRLGPPGGSGGAGWGVLLVIGGILYASRNGRR